MYVRKYDLDSNTTSLTRFNAFNKYNLKRLIVEEKDNNQTNYIAKIYLKLTKRKYKIRYYLMNNLEEFKENFQNQTPQEVIEYYADEVVKEYLPSSLNFAYQNFVYDMKVVGDNVLSNTTFNHENYTKKAYEYPRENSGYDVINIGFESKKRRFTTRFFTEKATTVNGRQAHLREEITEQIQTDNPDEILSSQKIKEKLGAILYRNIINFSRYQQNVDSSYSVGQNKGYLSSNIIELDKPIRTYFRPSNNIEEKLDLKLLVNDYTYTGSKSDLTFKTNSYESKEYQIMFKNLQVGDNMLLKYVIRLLASIYQNNNDSIISKQFTYCNDEDLTKRLSDNRAIKDLELNGGNIYYKRIVYIMVYSINKNGTNPKLKTYKQVLSDEYNLNFVSALGTYNNKTFIIEGQELTPSEYQNMTFKQFIKKFSKANRYKKMLYYYEQ